MGSNPTLTVASTIFLDTMVRHHRVVHIVISIIIRWAYPLNKHRIQHRSSVLKFLTMIASFLGALIPHPDHDTCEFNDPVTHQPQHLLTLSIATVHHSVPSHLVSGVKSLFLPLVPIQPSFQHECAQCFQHECAQWYDFPTFHWYVT